MIDIICTAEKATFSCKDESRNALDIYIGVGARDLYTHEAHTALDIFRFAVFLIQNLG